MNKLTRLVVGLLALWAALAQADELGLTDGSRLLGKVSRMKEGAVEFETTYAGTLQVQWGQVSDMRVDDPVDVYLASREAIKVSGVHVEGDTLALEQPGAARRVIAASELVSINPEDWERGDGYRVTGQLNAGMEFQQGNTDQEKLALDGGVKLRRLHDRVTFVVQYQKDKSDRVTTAENWLLRNKYDYFVTDKRYYGASLNFENDRFADLKLRTSLGPHAGYQFYESERLNLAADLSLLYVMDDFYIADDDEYAALGWSIDFDWMLLPGRIQFYHRQDGLLEPGESENVVVDSWTGLRFPLYAGLVASTEAQVEFDGAAPSGVDKVDTIWRVKLGYQW